MDRRAGIYPLSQRRVRERELGWLTPAPLCRTRLDSLASLRRRTRPAAARALAAAALQAVPR